MQPENTPRRWKLIIAWFDFWVGFYYDRKQGVLYFFPVPCIGVAIDVARYYLITNLNAKINTECVRGRAELLDMLEAYGGRTHHTRCLKSVWWAWNKEGRE